VADTSVPSLQRDPEIGRITVVGGRPAVEGVDYNVEEANTPADAERDSPAAGEEPGARRDAPPGRGDVSPVRVPEMGDRP
jgi:hypothetical protein